MRPLLLCFALGAVLPRPAPAQPLRDGIFDASLAGATPAARGDLWGRSNPASWGGFSRPALGIFASRGYGLRALQQGDLQALWPLGAGAISVGAATFGGDAFREQRWMVGAAFGWRPGTARAIDLGVRLTYHRLLIAGYEGLAALSLGAGWQADLSPTLRAGFSADNVNGARWARGERLPRRLSAGLAYRPTPSAAVFAALRKETWREGSSHVGVDWHPVPALSVRVGVATAPRRAAGGFALAWRGLRVEAAVERHFALGWTPALAVSLLAGSAL